MFGEKKESWLREELHKAEHGFGDFGKKVEESLSYAEKKYGRPKEGMRKRFYSYINNLPYETQWQLYKGVMIGAISTFPLAMLVSSPAVIGYTVPITAFSTYTLLNSIHVRNQAKKKKLLGVI